MVQFLVKTFVKDYENTDNMKVRTNYGIFASIVSIITNVILFGIKFLIGLLAGAVSVISDAFNNLSDALSNIISFVGIKLSEKPADDDHPFGHGRIEYVTALIVSFLILMVGYEFLKSSIDAIIHPTEISFSVIPVVILTLSLLGKLFLAVFNKNIGKRIDSNVLLAAATDAVGDMYITSATIIGMIVYGVFHINVDGYVGIFVSFMILKAGYSVAKDTLQPLIGEKSDPEINKKIKDFVENHEMVTGTHDLIVHSYGPNQYMATIHAEVPEDANIVRCHEAIDQIEVDCKEKLGILVTIHMDPISVGPEAQTFKEIVATSLKEIDENLKFHDFRYVNGEQHINLIFDVVSERRLKPNEEATLRQQIQDKVHGKDSRLYTVITVDYGF